MGNISGNLEEGAESYDDGQPTFEDLMHMATHARRPDFVETDRWDRPLGPMATLESGSRLDDTLNRILRLGAELTGARCAALAVAEWGEHPPLRLLFTHGNARPDAGQLDAVLNGGLLGSTARPAVETDDLAARRSNRRASSPPRAVLGVPVVIAGLTIGTLHFTDKSPSPNFTEHDAQVARALAGVAAMAIDNSRLHEQATHRERWISATGEAALPHADDTAFQIVAEWARDVSGADVAWVVSGTNPADASLRAVSGFEADPAAMTAIDFTRPLTRCPTFVGPELKARHGFERLHAVDVSAALGWVPMAAALIVSLGDSSDGKAAVTVAWSDHVEPARLLPDAALPMLLTEQAPLVLHVAQIRQDERRLAVLEDRDRIARELHDLVIQQLFAVGLELQSISWLSEPGEMATQIDRTTVEIDAIIREIRNTIFHLGSMNDSADPRAAVVEVVQRAARTMKVRPTLHFHGPVKSLIGTDLLPDVLGVLTEALSNAVRHAYAETCVVEVSVDSRVTVRVQDDGIGMPPGVVESGLGNLRQRADQRGGRLELSSTPGSGTTLSWSVPLD